MVKNSRWSNSQKAENALPGYSGIGLEFTTAVL